MECGVRWDTWVPPYKVILDMGEGRGRTPPLRMAGEFIRRDGGIPPYA